MKARRIARLVAITCELSEMYPHYVGEWSSEDLDNIMDTVDRLKARIKQEVGEI